MKLFPITVCFLIASASHFGATVVAAEQLPVSSEIHAELSDNVLLRIISIKREFEEMEDYYNKNPNVIINNYSFFIPKHSDGSNESSIRDLTPGQVLETKDIDSIARIASYNMRLIKIDKHLDNLSRVAIYKQSLRSLGVLTKGSPFAQGVYLDITKNSNIKDTVGKTIEFSVRLAIEDNERLVNMDKQHSDRNISFRSELEKANQELNRAKEEMDMRQKQLASFAGDETAIAKYGIRGYYNRAKDDLASAQEAYRQIDARYSNENKNNDFIPNVCVPTTCDFKTKSLSWNESHLTEWLNSIVNEIPKELLPAGALDVGTHQYADYHGSVPVNPGAVTPTSGASR